MESRNGREGWYIGRTPATNPIATPKHVRSIRTCGANPSSSAAYVEERINRSVPGDSFFEQKQERWNTCRPGQKPWWPAEQS